VKTINKSRSIILIYGIENKIPQFKCRQVKKNPWSWKYAMNYFCKYLKHYTCYNSVTDEKEKILRSEHCCFWRAVQFPRNIVAIDHRCLLKIELFQKMIVAIDHHCLL